MKFIGDEFYYPTSVFEAHGTASQMDLEKAPQADGIPWQVTGGTLSVINGSAGMAVSGIPSNNYNVQITDKQNPVEGKFVIALKALPAGQWQAIRSYMLSSLPDEYGLKNSDYGLVMAAKGDLSSYYRIEFLWQDGMPAMPDPACNVYRVVNDHVTQLQPVSTPGVSEFAELLMAAQGSEPISAAIFTGGFTPPQQYGTNTSVSWSQPGVIVTTDGNGGVSDLQCYLDPSPLTGTHAGFFLQDQVRGRCFYWEIDNGDHVTAHSTVDIDTSIRTSPAVTAHTINQTAATPTGDGGVPTYTGSRVDENYNNYSNGTPPTTTSGGTSNPNPGDAFEGGEFDDGPDPATL